ncbi:MAG: nickase, partial [Noviherbaspirillum sp.]|nr:nickase [Noviherbaspirillum sp.]
EGTPSDAVRNAAREFTKNTFGKNHEYVFALHTDEPHPHVHITVKTRGFNRRRLHIGKDTAQEWREEFADALQREGVDAEATPRSSRGVVRKPEKQVIRHIERGDKTHKPRVSKVRAAKIKEVAAELSAEAKGQAVKPRPWEEKIQATQAAIRAAWLAAATQLEQSRAPDDKSFADRIKTFVAAMPRIDTERHETRRALMERFGRQRDKHQVNSAAPQTTRTPEPKNGADQAAPSCGSKGMER